MQYAGILQKNITTRGYIASGISAFLVLFYVLLYQFPEKITWLIRLFDPLSVALNGDPATQWFMYGVLYTSAVVGFGVVRLYEHRHNRYILARTLSVMFFQTAIAFFIPQLLHTLNLPEVDLKDIWPLKYYFFFDWNIDQHLAAGTIGLWMFGWGTFLFLVGVPVMTYFFGKRWYCSWVCGCGGLAETAGDSFRHLSDKSIKAWKIERYSINGVFVFAVVMTLFVLYTYITGNANIGFISSYQVREWYGFGIGFVFAGAVGTGMYPLLGNRTWCRFGCPLAAYLGFWQKKNSKYRITTNGGQCISCGNCSAFCEMGIDVRAYAQRGQDITRASCVGCGICSEVCPRGVLNLENALPNTRKTEVFPFMLGNKAKNNDFSL